MSDVDDGTLTRLLNSDAETLNVAGAKVRAIQKISSMLTKIIAKRTIPGQRLIQQSGNIHKIIEYYDANGRKHIMPYNAESMAKIGSIKDAVQGDSSMGPNEEYRNKYFIKGLNHMNIDVKKSLSDSEIETLNNINNEHKDNPKARYNALKEAGLLEVSKGQILLPAYNLNRYGLSNSSQPFDIFYYINNNGEVVSLHSDNLDFIKNNIKRLLKDDKNIERDSDSFEYKMRGASSSNEVMKTIINKINANIRY